MKKIILTLLLVLILALTACAGNSDMLPSEINSENNETAASQSANTTDLIETDAIQANFDDDDFTPASTGSANTITLNGISITAAASVEVNGSTATITAAGSYEIKGTLENGQIIVNTQDAENVTLLLSGVDIHNEGGPPIYVANAEKVILTLVEGTQNNLSDGTSYANQDGNGEPNAAIFSHDDLTINGSGNLIVNANYNNGIASKDDLKITGGTITVTAVNDGIKGKDSVAVKDGDITINAGADGIQSTNEDDADKGYIAIEGGVINITSTLDGIQAATSLSITDGQFNILTGGGTVNNSTNGGGLWGKPGNEGNPNQITESAKGLKAATDIIIDNGTFNINSADDSINANNNITINGGTIQAASGDDGMHADASLTINGGEINISQSYEGFESAMITVNNGTIHLTASDDGFNVAGGADGSSMGGRPGQNTFADMSNYMLTINGGYIFIDAGGDGLDSNGSFVMTGGTAIVNGPTNNSNGPLDYNGTFNISGGFLVAVGSSGMAEAPSDTSTQYSVIHNFETIQAAGSLINIQDQNGNDVLTFVPTKEIQSVLVSSAELQNGMVYTLYIGGSVDGTQQDGLYTDASYTPGTQIASFTIENMVTRSGVEGGTFGKGDRGPGTK